MIRILTDSTADIPLKLCKAYQIETIPIYIFMNGNTYRDGEDIDPAAIFKNVEKTGVFPTTSAPSPADFINLFKKEEPTIYIGVSSKLSATFENALRARNEVNNDSIDIIDSCSISTGYGQVVLQAAKWRNDGMEFEDLGHHIRSLIKKTRGIFILDTLEYLYRGGRCSAIKHFVTSLLKIRPLLNVEPNGTLSVIQKISGTRSRAVKGLLKYIQNQLNSFQIKQMFIMHLDCEEDAAYLKNEIKPIGHPVDMQTAQIGCALVMHSGPKPLGIAYIVNGGIDGNLQCANRQKAVARPLV